jgi:hypothetical protein
LEPSAHTADCALLRALTMFLLRQYSMAALCEIRSPFRLFGQCHGKALSIRDEEFKVFLGMFMEALAPKPFSFWQTNAVPTLRKNRRLSRALTNHILEVAMTSRSGLYHCTKAWRSSGSNAKRSFLHSLHRPKAERMPATDQEQAIRLGALAGRRNPQSPWTRVPRPAIGGTLSDRGFGRRLCL